MRRFIKMSFCCAALGLLLAGCSGGSDGAPGAAGAAGADGQDVDPAVVADLQAQITELQDQVKLESCATCHRDAGDEHQAVYDQYTDASAFTLVIDEASVVSVPNGDNFDVTMEFTITKNGAPYVDAGLAGVSKKKYAAVKYDDATRDFGGAGGASVFDFGSPTHLGDGKYRVTKTAATFDPTAVNADIVVYIADDMLEGVGSGYSMWGNSASDGVHYGVPTYTTTANVSACENCHGTPYLKHSGERPAHIEGLQDFVACKICHLDDKAGSHQAWQLLVDDPAAYAAQDGVLTDEQKATYAYKRNVMNDVHMSHAMEFAYPQSMANCATCHAGKLTSILTDANFTLTTCKSCHPVTGPEDTGSRAPGLETVIPHNFSSDTDCTTCHKAANGIAPVFSAVHTGYNAEIYNADGDKYADEIVATIDSASITGNVLTATFTVNDVPEGATLTPSFYVSLYGYNTKDFLVSSHTSDANGKRLEKTFGTANTLFTEVDATGPTYTVSVDLGAWAPPTTTVTTIPAGATIPEMIASGVIKRAEIAVLPAVTIDGVYVGLNAPSKTFDFAANGFVDYYAPIVSAAKCNKCHDQLATSFHSGNRGGNVVVCRMCHTVASGGSHLEMQSRSIDSYVHAIHSFQVFDPNTIDDDAVSALHYEHHIESTYPNFTLLNCKSCHESGTFNVPDQTKSMASISSAADTMAEGDLLYGRNIGTVASVVTGPGSRACGSCHRAKMINEDEAGELAAFNQHTATFGYNVSSVTGLWTATVEKIMGLLD